MISDDGFLTAREQLGRRQRIQKYGFEGARAPRCFQQHYARETGCPSECPSAGEGLENSWCVDVCVHTHTGWIMAQEG